MESKRVVSSQEPVVREVHRRKRLASSLRTLAVAAVAFAAGGAWATEYSYDADTHIESMEITEDSTLSGGHTLTVTNFTGSADAMLTITGNSTLLPLKLSGWDTSLPSFQIDSGSTLSLYLDYIDSAFGSGTLYLHSPVHGTGTLYLRTYQKDEHVFVNSTNSTFSGTLSIYHRAGQRTRNGIHFGRDGGPDGGYFPNRPLMSCAGNYTGNVYLGRYIATTPLTVRGLSGAQSIIQTADDSYSGNRFIDVELAANYSFSGTFVKNGDSAANPQPSLLVSTKDGTAYTQTLSGENTTYGELIVTNGATVNLTGSWANGPIIVEDFSKLTTSASKTISSLTLKSESVLTLANASSGITTTTTEVGDGNTVLINFTDASDIATAVSKGTALISWTTKPTGGNFVFASSELNQAYELVIGDSGLTIAERETPLVLTGVWTGNGKTTEWSNVLNWENNMIPGADATATFPASGAPWTVTLSDGMKTVGALVAEGDVTFSGARIQVCDPDTETPAVSGAGTIILGDDAGFYAGSDANLTLTLAANMKITASSDHVAQIKGRTSGAGSGGAKLRINGNLSGTGYLEVGGSRSSINFNGNNSEFAGFVTVLDDASSLGGAHRTSVQFAPNAASANAAWNIVYNNNSTFLGSTGSSYVYSFGELTGEINNSEASMRATSVVELGALNTDFELIYKSISHDNRKDTIVKRGTGTMTMLDGTSNIGIYDIAAGTLYVASQGGAPAYSVTFTGGKLRTRSYEIDSVTYKADWSALIKNSTAAIAFDDDGVDYTWATAIASSNTGGLTKLGSGTLTLSAAPEYTGSTMVKEGVLLVPTGTTLTLSSGTKQDGTVEVDTVTYDKYVPYNVASVTVSETTYNFSSVAEAASFAKTNGNATVVITAELASTETIYIAAGEAFSLTVSDPNNYLTDGKAIAVVAADGTTVEAEEGTYSYTCPKEWTASNMLTGTTTISESYFSTSDLYVPKNSNSAMGTLSVTGSGTKFNVGGAVNVAYANYSIGEIDIKDNAEMSITGLMRIGNNAGTGTVHVASGKLSVGNNFYVADGNSSGTVIVSGGTVDVAGEGRIAPGGNGVGELTITGGTVNFNSTSANTSVGYGANSNGRLNVYGGTLKVPSKDLVISANNTGSRGFFDFASGTVTLGKGLKLGGKDGNATTRGYASGIISNNVTVSANELKIGNAKYSDAELTVAGGETTVTSTIDIGANECANGLIEMTGGTVTDNGGMNVGRGATSYGYFKMSGGTLTMGGSASGFQVGFGTSATGVVEVTGGTVTIPNNSNAYFNVPNDSATSTEAAPLCGKVIIGGTGNVTAKHMNIGAQKYSDAYLTVTGGTLTVETKLRVGGKYQDGELDATAVGTYTQTDGAVTAAAFGIGMGGATGSATLSGGTLTVPAITKGTGSATLNLNGGTLKASADSNDFIADGITLNIQEGGIVIDTDGHNVTITQAINTEYTIVKKGTGTLTFSNGDNIDVDNITVEAGGVVIVQTAKTVYIGEFSFTGDRTFINETVDYVGADVTYTGGFFLSNGNDQSSTVGISNSVVRALRCNLADGSALNNSVNRLNIWKGGKLITTSTEGYAAQFQVGYRGVDNILNVVGGEVTTAAEMILNSTATYALTVSEGGVVTVGSLTGSSSASFDGGVLVPYAASESFASAPIVVGANGLIVSNDVAITMSSAISGTGGLTKKGSGVLALTTAPTFTGTITVAENGGSVVVPNTCTVTAGANTVRNDGESDTYVFTYSASSGSLEPGQTDGKTYDTQEAAQTAAAAITQIVIPSAVSSVVTTEAQITAYKALFSAQAVASTTSEGKYVVVVDFKADKKTELESALTQEFADVDFTAVATTGAAVQIAEPIAGLYYGVLYSADPANVTTLYGDRQLSDGSALNLTLPSGEGTVQFYKLQVSTTAE